MLFVVAGFLSGIIGALFGVGGGEIFIPVLVYAFGFSQHQAHGTALAVLLPPVGLLAVLRSCTGHVQFTAALPLTSAPPPARNTVSIAHIGLQGTAGPTASTRECPLQGDEWFVVWLSNSWGDSR